jgi:prepilin-type N-terminal cleavage/methylation domain-containing protein
MSATASIPSGGRRAAFTLLEVLVTIALIALLTGVLVVGTNRLLGDRPKTGDELFWEAAGAARHEALFNQRDVRLSLDPKKNEFVVMAPDGSEKRHPFVVKEIAEIDFLAPRSPGLSSSILLGGQLVETQTVPFVTFYRDGTCSPFRAQMKSRNGTRILEIDPWTCAQVLVNRPAS